MDCWNEITRTCIEARLSRRHADEVKAEAAEAVARLRRTLAARRELMARMREHLELVREAVNQPVKPWILPEETIASPRGESAGEKADGQDATGPGYRRVSSR